MSTIPPERVRFANDWLVASPEARDFGQAYLSKEPELRHAAESALMQSFAFRSALSHPGALRDYAYESCWRGVEVAFAGNWAARVEAVVRAGIRFARLGADLFDWELLNAATSRVVRSTLVDQFGHDAKHLVATLDVLQRFYDRSFCAFSEAYLSGAQELLYQADVMVRLSSVGQAIVDGAGIVHRPNDAFLNLYGLTPATAHGLDFLTLFQPQALEVAREQYFPLAEASGRLGYDSTHLRADGTAFPIRVEAVRIAEGRRGATWGMLLYDLTERKQAESIRARSIELEAENFHIREASRAKSEFLANMSHELRTPLNSILGFSQLLASAEVGHLSDQQQDFVEDIHRSGRHLLHLINDVLDLSKVEAGKLEFFPEDVDLAEVMADVTHIARGLAGGRELEVHVDADVRTARLDAGRFKQVLLNYVSNALKFSPADRPVRVRVAASGADAVHVSVEDRGVGIAPDDVPRLFMLFEQLDAGRTKHHAGTGLGLALTRRIVEAQGGSVHVESELGRGSTFHAIIPRYQREPPTLR